MAEALPPDLPPGAPSDQQRGGLIHLVPRTVAWQRAFAWYEEAMRLFKRAPAAWIALAAATLAAEFALEILPVVGPLAGKIVVPLVACGLVFAARAVDRGDTPVLALALAPFREPLPAIATIVGTALATFGVEAATAWWVGGVNLLSPDDDASRLSVAAVLGVYTIGILASLPLTFVPFHLLLERAPAVAALAASWQAFVLNTVPLLAYAGFSLILLGLGLATMGIGLVLVLPLWAASSYAAWKDIFGVRAVQ